MNGRRRRWQFPSQVLPLAPFVRLPDLDWQYDNTPPVQPEDRPNVATGVAAGPPLLDIAVAATVTLDQWYQPASEPVRRAPRRGVEVDITESLAEYVRLPDIDWFVQHHNPTLPKRRALDIQPQEPLEAFPEVVLNDFDWLFDPPQPVLPEDRPNVAAGNTVVQFRRLSNSLDSWFRPLSEPVQPEDQPNVATGNTLVQFNVPVPPAVPDFSGLQTNQPIFLRPNLSWLYGTSVTEPVLDGGYAVSALEVWNIALLEIGQPPINDINDDLPRANKLRAVWTTFRRHFLALHSWHQATRTKTLAQTTETPVGPWSYSYALPSDYIRAMSVNDRELEDGRDLWSVELDPNKQNVRLYTDSNSVKLRYVADTTQVGILSPATIQAMGIAFAAHVASAFGVKASENRVIEAKAKSAVNEAKSINGRTSPGRTMNSSPLLDARDDMYRGRFPYQGETY